MTTEDSRLRSSARASAPQSSRGGASSSRYELQGDMLRALGRATVAMAQLDVVVGDDDGAKGVGRPSWWRSVERLRLEWDALLAAIAHGDTSGDFVYVRVGDGAIVPFDAPRIERFSIRLRQVRVEGIARGDIEP